jgi:hypothetical protein
LNSLLWGWVINAYSLSSLFLLLVIFLNKFTVNDVLLSESLVAAIGTVVTVSEILKNNGLATEKSKQLVSPVYHLSYQTFPDITLVNHT